MIVKEADCPSVKMHEISRLQLTLADLPSSYTLNLLPPLSIADWIRYTLPPWFVSCPSRKRAVSLTYVSLAHTGLITGAEFSPTLCHQTSYSTLLLKRGTI